MIATTNQRERRHRGALQAACCLLLVVAANASAQTEGSASEERWRRSPATWYRELVEPTPPGRWPGSIIELVRESEAKALPQEAVLFAGSATIAIWPTEELFPEYRTLRRGFGGSQISDSTFFADRLIVPARPSTIVLYAGDNDVFGGKSAYLTALHFEEFLWKIHFELPNTQIIFVSIRPSISRWSFVDQFREANRLIREVVDRYEFVGYVDIDAITIGPDGMPRKDFFSDDDLHLSAKGYAAWSAALRPALAEAEARYQELKAANPVNAPRLAPPRTPRGR
jgi:hypothetical protein